MELGKDKLKYVVNYAIAPFFVEGLKKQVSGSDWIVVCDNESLNNAIQISEMDLVFRFWDNCLIFWLAAPQGAQILTAGLPQNV